MSNTSRVCGKVVSFSGGHGFIAGDSGIVYFVHHGDIEDAEAETMPALEVGATVEFLPEEGGSAREPSAREVRRVS